VTVVEKRPRGVAVLLASPRRAVALTILAGGAISLQSYLNGRLGSDVGSPVIAGAINNLVALVAVVSIVLATGALPRARDRLRALGRPPFWYFLGGLAGAGLVLVSAAAAPEVGVALLTVALVSGSTGGSLPVDAAGLGPAGRRPITAPRVAGVALAIVATVISALGAPADLDLLLLGGAFVAGVTLALQAAANGQLARATGEPWAATLVNVAVGFTALGVVAVVVLATANLDSMPGNPLLYLGGLLGAYVVVVTATAVQTLGVLRLGLAMVAGQMAGALVVDLIAPARGEEVTLATVVGVVLTLVAVVISGRSRREVAPRYP
jgi:bacterial/archaeal transporter family-2 protein